MDASRQHFYDDFNSLSDECLDSSNDNSDNNESSRVPLCPRLIVSIYSVPCQGLVDTGSQITAMSENFYQYLKNYNKLIELPISNIILFTAIGKKSTHIKKQILCEMKVGERTYQTSFLIVPHLSNPIILGNDWFLAQNVIIDYKYLTMTIKDDILDSSLVSFGKKLSKKFIISEREDGIKYIQLISSLHLSNACYDDSKGDCQDNNRVDNYHCNESNNSELMKNNANNFRDFNNSIIKNKNDILKNNQSFELNNISNHFNHNLIDYKNNNALVENQCYEGFTFADSCEYLLIEKETDREFN